MSGRMKLPRRAVWAPCHERPVDLSRVIAVLSEVHSHQAKFIQRLDFLRKVQAADAAFLEREVA